MEDDFQSPGLWSNSSKPSVFWKLLALSLIALVVNFGISLSHVNEVGGIFGKQAKSSWSQASRWTWEPYKLEYDNYKRHHYNLDWLEGSSAENFRRIGGKISPLFELLALRGYGFLYYLPYLAVSIFFAISMGSVHYYDKKLYFGNISSTINNIAIKTFIIVFILAIIWCSLPFGMKFPVVGEIPIEASIPVIGTLWLSNPATGAFLFGSFYSVAAYMIGANFSREI